VERHPGRRVARGQHVNRPTVEPDWIGVTSPDGLRNDRSAGEVSPLVKTSRNRQAADGERCPNGAREVKPIGGLTRDVRRR
jgi:hypothetical protein